MKKHASALALAALLAAPAANAATAIDFSGEFEVNAFSVDYDDGADDTRGFQQLLRLGANAKLDDGVQVVTRLNLQDNTWEGDTRADLGGANQPYSPDAADVVTLDLGYVQLPMGPGVLRVGRQESNWGICFVSCDDRRDRIQWVGKVGGFTAGAGFDKRDEGQTAAPADPIAVDDDATGYYGFAIGKIGPALAGLLVYRVQYDELYLNTAQTPATLLRDGDVTVVSPYFQTKLAGINLEGTFAWQQLNSDLPGVDLEDRMGAFVRGGYDLGVAKLEAQAVWTDGYAPNQGFDSFSSMINNSPENSNSPVSVYDIGQDTIGIAARVSGNVTNQVKLVGSAGLYQDGDNAEPGITGTDTDATFFEVQAQYQLAPSTLVWATAGRVSLEPDVGPDEDRDAISLNVLTKF